MPDYYNQFRRRLTQEEQQVNATFIYGYLNKRGWSLNAIAAGCGNWESECTMNPNRPQYSSYPSSGEGASASLSGRRGVKNMVHGAAREGLQT